MKISNTIALTLTGILAAGCTTTSHQASYQEPPVYKHDVVTTPPDYHVTTPTSPVISSYPSTPSPTEQGAGAAAQMSDSDRELMTSVRNQFDRYGDLSGIAPNIGVSSQNGTVTLTGSVPGEKERQMVEAMVKNTPGVVSVNNQIRISAPGVSSLSDTDRALVETVRTTLNSQPSIAGLTRNVQVDARNGTVTLTGNVPTPEDRQLIENLVRNSSGVTGVIDELQVASVEPTGRAETSRVYSATAGEIFNLHVQGLTDADRALAQRILEGLRTDTVLASMLPVVDIQVADGKVTLQGNVQNSQQKQTIATAVQRAAGTGNVMDLLRVQPSR